MFGCMMTLESEKGSTQGCYIHCLFLVSSEPNMDDWNIHLTPRCLDRLSCGESHNKTSSKSAFGIEMEFRIPLQIAWHRNKFGGNLGKSYVTISETSMVFQVLKNKSGGTVKHLVENTRPLVNGWCRRREAKWIFDGLRGLVWPGLAAKTLTHLGDCFEGIRFPTANLWCTTYSAWISLHQPSVLAHWQAWCFLTCPSADATWKAWQSDGVAEREETGIQNIGKN